MSEPKFRMLVDRVLRGEVMARAGDIVYPCTRHDYGGASDDARLTGGPHKSMTHDPNGDYPFFTVPVRDMEPTYD